MDSADDLSSLRAYTHYLPVGIRVWAPLQLSLVREPLDVSSTVACVREVCVLFACAECLILDLLALLRPATHRAGVRRGWGSKPRILRI